MKYLWIVLTYMCFMPVIANAETVPNEPPTITVEINGLVCDFCARAMDKVFSKRDEVVAINVDFDSRLLSIWLHQGQEMDDALVTKLVNDGGYDVVTISRAGA